MAVFFTNEGYKLAIFYKMGFSELTIRRILEEAI